MTIPMEMKWAVHAARMEELRNTIKL